MEDRRIDVEHSILQKGGAAPEGLYTQDRPSFVPKCCRPGTQTQHGSLLDPGVPLWHNLEGSSTLPHIANSYPVPHTKADVTGVHTLCRTLEGGV